jgi:hypothetical protein
MRQSGRLPVALGGKHSFVFYRRGAQLVRGSSRIQERGCVLQRPCLLPRVDTLTG